MSAGGDGMGVRVCDFKGDGQAWVVVFDKGKRKTMKVGDWDKARVIAQQFQDEQDRERGGKRSALLLRDVLENHRASYVVHLKYNTCALHSGRITNHITPILGDIDVYDLTEADVVAFIEKKLQTLSPSSVRGCVNILRQALRRLRKTHPDLPEFTVEVAEILGRAENASAEEIKSVNAWTCREATKVLEIVRKHEPGYYPLILTALHTGMRRGEMLGLQWQDVDFDRARFLIRRNWTMGRIGLPKHRKRTDAPRAVVITPMMADALRGLATFRYAKSGDWVFPSSKGTPIQETQIKRVWDRVKIKSAQAGVRPLRFHDMRHTFATLSLEAGRSIKWVAEQLGHRDASVTLNVYAHALPVKETDLSYLPGVTTTRAVLRRVAEGGGDE